MSDWSPDPYPFPEQFRKQILALMLKQGWLSRYIGVIQPEYFPVEQEETLARYILSHRDEYGSLPLYGDAVREMPASEDWLYDVYSLATMDLSRTEAEVIEWAQDCAYALALVQSVDDHERKDYRSIRLRFEEASKVGRDVTDLGTELVVDNSWMYNLQSDVCVPTPWMNINNIIFGGLYGGELGIIVAPAGGMKSTALVNIGMHAASIVHKKNIIHFTLEMSTKKVLRRYAARLTGKFVDDAESYDAYAQEIEHHARRKLRGRLLVKQYATNQATVSDLKDFTMARMQEGFDPGLLIVDYPDLLRPRRYYKDRRFELQEIYSDLRGLAVELDIPVWGATQGNRGSYAKTKIRLEDIAEDIGKAQISDVVLSLSRTEEEEEAQKARLFVAKMRDTASLDGSPNIQVMLKVIYPALIDTGIYRSDDNGNGSSNRTKSNSKRGRGTSSHSKRHSSQAD